MGQKYKFQNISNLIVQQFQSKVASVYLSHIQKIQHLIYLFRIILMHLDKQQQRLDIHQRGVRIPCEEDQNVKHLSNISSSDNSKFLKYGITILFLFFIVLYLINSQAFTFLQFNSKCSKNYPFSLKNGLKKVGDQQFIATLGSKDRSIPYNRTVVKGHEQQVEFDMQLKELLKPSNDTNCIYERYGDFRDGGYVMCNNSLKQAQAILNFGVEGRDLFGCHLSSNLSIPNFQYDCTNSIQPACEGNGCNNHFNHICIGNETGKFNSRQFYSVEDIINGLGLKEKHIIIKIDIESWQWPAFQSLPISYLDNIDQIIMQVHKLNKDKYAVQTMWGHLTIIQNLMEHFVNINFHINNWACYVGDKQLPIPADAFEVALVNKKILKVNSPTKSFKEHRYNRANADQLYNCHMDQF